MNLHVLAPFHTVPSLTYSHCAFTGKVMRFPAMMAGSGHRIIEYANAGSESKADEHVEMLSRTEFAEFYGKRRATDIIGQTANMGVPGNRPVPYTVFSAKLVTDLRKRVEPGDIVCHPFGKVHTDIVGVLPNALHVETGIGYPDAPITAWRIFESECWRNWHLGKYDGHPLNQQGSTFVVPNYFDPAEWPLGPPIEKRLKKPYVAYLATRDGRKGLANLRDVVVEWRRRHPRSELKFHVAGQGKDGQPWRDFVAALKKAKIRGRSGSAWDLVVDRGSLVGAERAAYLGGAVVTLCLTQFVEPFGGTMAESLLCGTPVVGSDWGAYCEYLVPGQSGVRCRTLSETINAIEEALEGEYDESKTLREDAVKKFGYDAVRERYVDVFDRIVSLREKGWAG